jgi:hypothetical protein
LNTPRCKKEVRGMRYHPTLLARSRTSYEFFICGTGIENGKKKKKKKIKEEWDPPRSDGKSG